MKRKWEWIQEKCEQLGLTREAEIAGQVDATLNALYEKRHTAEWKKDYKKINKEELTIELIDDIATSGSYCVACEETSEFGCGGCLFKERMGECFEPDTLLYLFDDLIEVKLEAERKRKFKNET